MIICVVDDHEMMRDATVIVIGRIKKNAEIKAFSTFEQFIRAVDEFGQPDLLLLDLTLPNIKEYEGVRIARERCPDSKIAIYSAYPAEDRARKSLASGADIYIEKGKGLKNLNESLHDLMS
jgi:DNA-binding NarL/FixJ family response regulator